MISPDTEKRLTPYRDYGFSSQHLKTLGVVIETAEDHYIEPKFLKNLPDLIASIFDTDERRSLILTKPHGMLPDDYAYRLLHLFECLSSDQKKSQAACPTYIQDIASIVDELTRQPKSCSEEGTFDKAVQILVDSSFIIVSPRCYFLFNHDPLRTAQFVAAQLPKVFDLDYIGEETMPLMEAVARGDLGEVGSPSLQRARDLLTDNKNLDLDYLVERAYYNRTVFDKKVGPIITVHHLSADQWPDRLSSLNELLGAYDLGRTTLEEVNQELFRQYAIELTLQDLGRVDDSTVANYLAEIHDATPSERNQILFYMYSSLDKKRGALGKFRRSLNHLDTRAVELEQSKQLAKIYEHPQNPINTILARKHGYEIEYPLFSTKFDGDNYELFSDALEQIGVHPGMGGSGMVGNGQYRQFGEISPGPFFHPSTGIAVARQFLHGGLINPYLHTGHSIHLNTDAFIDPKNLDFFGLGYLRFLYTSLCLTCYTFDPSRGRNPDGHNDFLFRLTHLKWNSLDYVESSNRRDEIVSFDYLNPLGFDLFWNEAINLANTASGQMRLKHRLVPNQTVKPYFHQLSGNWNEHVRLLNQGLKNLGLGAGIVDLSMDSFCKIKPLLLEVFPSSNRGDNPDEIETGHPVTVEGQKWPNIVSFARDLNRRTSSNTLATIGQFEYEFLQELKHVNASASKSARKAFCRLYNLPELTTIEKEDTIEVLSSLYADRL